MENKPDKTLSTEEFLYQARQVPHPRTYEIKTLVVMLVTGVLGSIIGMELMVNLGVSANTSIIGALIAVMIGLIPLKRLKPFQNIHRQNLVETSISASTFTAGNVFMLALGTIWLYGDNSLMLPMIVGCIIGVLVDICVMFWLFDTPAFPATGTWGPGVATSETIISVAQGGKRAFLLVGAATVGAIGQFFGIPMDIVGVCWIGNVWALTMFGVGLLATGYSTQLFGFAIREYYIPHGIMIGAGIVALIQLGTLLMKKKKPDGSEEKKNTETYQPIKEASYTIKSITRGSVLFVIGALIMAIMAGFLTQMSIPVFIWWVIFAGVTSVIAEMLIGTAAMHAGWFPAMATSLIFLVLGMLMQFPPTALALLAGYKVCTGPAFADMGYDLKTGWLLRGRGADREYEITGQREQFKAEIIGAVVGIVVALLSYQRYFSQGLFPPAAKVFAATIEAGTSPEILKYLLIFAVVGGVIQLIGGTKRQIGVLFATGLLIGGVKGGWAALIAILIRIVLQKKFGEKINNTIAISAAGFITGSSLFNFGRGTINTIRTKL